MKRIPWPFRRAAGGEITASQVGGDHVSVWVDFMTAAEVDEHRVEVTGVVVVDTYAPHRVKVTIGKGGELLFEFACSAPEGFACRMVCAQDCGALEDSEDCDCPKRDSGRCDLVDWLNSDSWNQLSMYDGPTAPLRSDYVELAWDADASGVTWKYFGDPPQPIQEWGVGADGATEPAYWFSGDQYVGEGARNLACDTVADLGGTLWVRDTAAWREVKAGA